VGWGIFEYVPYCGYQIKKFTIDNLLQWDELREALEPIAARRLAKKRPPEALKILKKHCDDMEEAYINMDSSALGSADYHFHLCVVENCGNDCFSQLQTISNLSACFYFGKSILEINQNMYNFSVLQYDDEYPGDEDDFKKVYATTIESHREMSEAIFSGDAVGAEEKFRHHARHQVKIVERYIKMVSQFK
jgi:DNA-binding GntR family transcriptional regulator